MHKKKVLGLIPARGGSKGILKKNIKELCGIPLIAWTINAAQRAQCIDRIVVSTDNVEIAEIAIKWGADVPFMRPAELAKDDVHRNPVVRHALLQLPRYDYVMLLQPTAPLRSAINIDEAMEILIHEQAESCVSVVEQHPSPYWMFRKNKMGRLEPVMSNWDFPQRRQDLPTTYALNGAIYIANTSYFLGSNYEDPFITPETILYEMSRNESVDIDDEFDISLAEFLIEKSNFKLVV